MSVRQQLRDAAIAALNAAPPTGVPQATKRRYVPGAKLTGPRLAVFFLEEETIQAAGSNSPIVRRAMIYGVQAVAAVEDPADADDAVEPMLAHVTEVLGDTNLGGLATRILELGTLWQTGEGNSGLFHIAALNRWRVEFQTRRDDIALKQ